LSRRSALNLCGIYSILLRTERLTIKPREIYATTPRQSGSQNSGEKISSIFAEANRLEGGGFDPLG
jgi:hypothetical protein